MNDKELHTEDKIIEAARVVFVKKGMMGARMQEIADTAGINKSLLHYYFRSKEKLFDAVLSQVIGGIGSMFGVVMQEDIPIENKLKLFVSTYMDTLQANPFLPNFILNEMNRNPEGLIKRFAESNIRPENFFGPIGKQLRAEGYNLSANEFMINTFSLTIFPVVVKPMLKQIVFDADDTDYDTFINNRKKSVVTFILNALSGYKI